MRIIKSRCKINREIEKGDYILVDGKDLYLCASYGNTFALVDTNDGEIKYLEEGYICIDALLDEMFDVHSYEIIYKEQVEILQR